MTKGNFVSEWFGHRVYPTVTSTPEAVADQQSNRCPFLSEATRELRTCIKADASKGVCTISGVSNGHRQDWLVCPYRALSSEIVAGAVRKLFEIKPQTVPFTLPAASLDKPEVRSDVRSRLTANQHVFVYFDAKTSGELSIPATERSPEFAFDVTIVEIVLDADSPSVGRFGFLEIQTMDFHGSYRAAVRNLKDGLRLHPNNFPESLAANPHWMSEDVEGPNIANVFKRTFYQMMFKFQLGKHGRCAGCVLAVPQSVWDSWQKHLGSPTLSAHSDGTMNLLAPGRKRPVPVPAWIYVFDTDATSSTTPSPILVKAIIATDVPSMSHWALEVAPLAALDNIDGDQGMLSLMTRRLRKFWPELANTIKL